MMFIFAYFGPETTLPLISGIMAVVGFAFVMGRNGFYFLGRWFRGVAGRLGLAQRPVSGARTPRKISDLAPADLERPATSELAPESTGTGR
jgi:hypothetical protein